MIIESDNQIKILISLKNIRELYSYQKGILALLNEVELDHCSLRRKQDIQRVYELLGHLYQNEALEHSQQNM